LWDREGGSSKSAQEGGDDELDGEHDDGFDLIRKINLGLNLLY
jgi:hypothetical protein